MRKISGTRSSTMDEDINRCCRLAVFNFQVFIVTTILSGFIHGCVGDGQGRAEKSWSAAVAGGEASAHRRVGPHQALPTSGETKRHARLYRFTAYSEQVTGERTTMTLARTCMLGQGCRICSSGGCRRCWALVDRAWTGAGGLGRETGTLMRAKTVSECNQPS